MRSLTSTATLLAVLLAASQGLAAGFRIDTQSGRGTAMAGAISALVDDASANFYNPAGLTAAGPGLEAQAGVALILPQLHYVSPTGQPTNMAFAVAPPPHVYARWGIIDQLAIGLGMFTPFGNNVSWPTGWPGQYLSTQATLQTFDLNLNVAVQPFSRLSFAGGVNVVRGTVYLARNINFIDSTGSAVLGGGAWGYGYNFGMQVEPIEHVMYVGATLRSPTNLDFTGNAHFSGAPIELGSQLVDQPVSAKVQLPMTVSGGIGFKIKEKVKIELDATFVAWSSFRSLDVNFQTTPALNVPEPKNWWDTCSVSLGLEVNVTPSLFVRTGVMFDPTPQPGSTLAPDLPDTTRLNVGAGVGWRHSSGFMADLGFQFITLFSNSSTAPGFPGTFGGTAEVVALTFGWNHPFTHAAVAPAAAAATTGASARR